MSYILEALKKSDRERRQGEIPGLQSDHGKRPDSGKRGQSRVVWKWVAAGILFLGILSALVFYQGMRKNDAALQEKINALEKTVGQLQEQPAQPDTAPPPSMDTAAAQIAAAGTANHVDELQTPAVSGYASSAATEETTEEDAEWAAGGGQPQVVEEETTADNRGETPDILPPPESASSPAKTVGQKATAEQAEDVPLMQDLPAGIRKRLPPLTLAGHVYAEDAAKRMIIINNRICREGDMVEDQLYLDRIVWEGVVLRYQEVRFRMNLL
jgi:general secretion pathway protein B